MALVLVGCGSAPAAAPSAEQAAAPAQPAPEARPKLGIASPGDAPYIAAQNKSLKDTGEKLGYEVIITNAGWDAAKQAEQIRDLVTQDLTGLIVMPVDGKAVVPAVAEAYTSGGGKLPILNLNSPIDDAGKEYVTGFVGPDDYGMAKTAGGLMCEALGNTGNVLIVAGAAGYPPTIFRRNGFTDGLKANCPDVQILDDQHADWDPTKSTSVTRDMLTRHQGNVNGIYGMDDGTAEGAVEALKAAGYEQGEVKVVGMGAYQSGIRQITAGWMYGTVQQDPFAEGVLTIETIDKVIKGQSVEEIVYLPMPAVTSENVAEFKPQF
jgi:ABC-type sugar transport system substrate-binding protein